MDLETASRVLLLGLGNDILTDDAVGLHVAHVLQRELASHCGWQKRCREGNPHHRIRRGIVYVLESWSLASGELAADLDFVNPNEAQEPNAMFRLCWRQL